MAMSCWRDVLKDYRCYTMCEIELFHAHRVNSVKKYP